MFQTLVEERSVKEVDVINTTLTCLEVIKDVEEEKDFYGQYAGIMKRNVMVNTAKKLNNLGFNFVGIEVLGSEDVNTFSIDPKEELVEGSVLTMGVLDDIKSKYENDSGYSSDG